MAHPDPIIAVAGATVEERSRSILLYLLCWTVQGFKVAWHKVARGYSVEWIGVSLKLERRWNSNQDWGESLHVQLSEEKTAKLKETLDSLLAQPVIPVKTLQYAAGVLGWLSSIVPIARPWMSMLLHCNKL